MYLPRPCASQSVPRAAAVAKNVKCSAQLSSATQLLRLPLTSTKLCSASSSCRLQPSTTSTSSACRVALRRTSTRLAYWRTKEAPNPSSSRPTAAATLHNPVSSSQRPVSGNPLGPCARPPGLSTQGTQFSAICWTTTLRL